MNTVAPIITDLSSHALLRWNQRFGPSRDVGEAIRRAGPVPLRTLRREAEAAGKRCGLRPDGVFLRDPVTRAVFVCKPNGREVGGLSVLTVIRWKYRPHGG